MGGVIGAVSNKFALAAATLFLPATVNQHRVQAVIDPSYPTSEISARLAAPGHIERAIQNDHRATVIGLGAEEFDAGTMAAAEESLPAGIDLRLGRDVLANHIFALNMRRDTIRLVVKSEYRGVTQGLIAVPLESAGGARWRLAARVDGTPCRLTFDLNLPNALALPSEQNRDLYDRGVDVSLGSAILHVPTAQIGSQTSEATDVVLGLRAFDGRQIVLDFPHHLLWVDPGAHNRL